MKTYLINLASRPDRLETATTQLNYVDPNFVRIDGVFFSNPEKELTTLVTLGVKGCWESHKKCFIDFLDTNEKFALICEDDLEITHLDFLNEAIRWGIHNQVDLLQLGFLLQGVRNRLTYLIDTIEQVFFKTIYYFSDIKIISKMGLAAKLRVRRYGNTPYSCIPDSFLPGTHCYLVSKRMVELIVSLNSPQFLSADDFFVALSKMRSFDMYRLRRSAVTQTSSAPSIDARFTGA